MTQSYRTDCVLAVLGAYRTMSLATVRPDGWPQVTMVGYINEGLNLYFVIGRSSQKYANIKRDNRVSLTIGGDFSDPLQIKGLSLAAKAIVFPSPSEATPRAPRASTAFPWPRAWVRLPRRRKFVASTR